MKARALPCDMVILDLEDAVADDRKVDARAALKSAFKSGFGSRIGAVRLNSTSSPHHDADLAALTDVAVEMLILPKVKTTCEAQAFCLRTGKPIIAMIETALGVVNARQIAAVEGVAGLFMGNNDLRRNLGIPSNADRSGLMLAMQSVILAARLAGKAVFDGVYNRLEDADGFEAECLAGKALGFDGKTLIHPNQIACANSIFGPGERELEEARALVAASMGGAERYDGRMIEAMHVAEARDLIERADATQHENGKSQTGQF